MPAICKITATEGARRTISSQDRQGERSKNAQTNRQRKEPKGHSNRRDRRNAERSGPTTKTPPKEHDTRDAARKMSQDAELIRKLIKLDPPNKERNKDIIYEETEVTEFIGTNTPNLQIQDSVEAQTTEIPHEDHVFSIY